MQALSAAVEPGNRNETKRLTQALLDAGAPPLEIVETGVVTA